MVGKVLTIQQISFNKLSSLSMWVPQPWSLQDWLPCSCCFWRWVWQQLHTCSHSYRVQCSNIRTQKHNFSLSSTCMSFWYILEEGVYTKWSDMYNGAGQNLLPHKHTHTHTHTVSCTVYIVHVGNHAHKNSPRQRWPRQPPLPLWRT